MAEATRETAFRRGNRCRRFGIERATATHRLDGSGTMITMNTKMTTKTATTATNDYDYGDDDDDGGGSGIRWRFSLFRRNLSLSLSLSLLSVPDDA